MPDRLFTPRFFTMFAYSFTVFVSLFQLLPAAPYRVLDLGGSTAVAGLFLGLLTYSSALSAPFTGAVVDRIGQRRVLIGVSLILAACSTSYAFIGSYRVMLAVVVVHGLFWSGLLSASSAYMMSTLPEHRRAEGLGYWGLASVTSIAVAPALGFWVYHHGWNVLCLEIAALNLIMATIAWRLPDDHVHAHATPAPNPSNLLNPSNPPNPPNLIEWRVVLLSITLSLVAFGYGGLTSFSSLFADALGVTPRSLFLSSMAAAILIGRLALGRMLDQIGHRRVFLTVLAAPAIGLLLLSVAHGRMTLLVAGLVFGAGFGLMYPAYAAYVMRHVATNRRGAAFGAIIAAFDTGVGTGSSAMGALIHRFGFQAGFATAAGLAALALPYFLFAEDRLGYKTRGV
jgi:predicted MFS family arabinose efflux permease